MDSAVKFTMAVAAILGAIAWPAAFLATVLVFRNPLKELLGRLRKGKVGFVEVELEQVAASAVQKTIDASGAVIAEQVHSAARIKARSGDIGESELLEQLDSLCLEYDTIRRAMRASSDRTRAMTEVLVKMRSIGPSVLARIEAYKGSGSPGSRLAAIAMMQMVPDKADLNWLLERFSERQAFIFYHAALALSNLANTVSSEKRSIVMAVAQKALSMLNRFDGEVDKNTVLVLESIVKLDERL